MRGRPLSILVLSTFDGSNANVIRDFLFSFHAHSCHRYYYVFNCRILDGDDFSAFDVILIFWSVYLLGPDLTPEVRARIRSARGVKVLFLQDEYRDVRPMNEAMRDLGVQVMFTCVAEADHETFYPRALVPTLDATYTVLPGYVPLYLENVGNEPESQNPIDVGYRSRDVPFYLGDLGREKRIIADRFEVICAQNGLHADISVREVDRLYGAAWVTFIRNSRCVLGTASGASVVDFSGEIRRNCERYLALHPEAPYEDVKARFFADIDWKFVIDTVSPRVFEAAALRCTMVHHEGGYAGLLEPDRHYICVKRDYSNVTEVVDRIRDHAFCRELAENTYRDLVASGQYSYRSFVRGFDARLARHVPGGVRAVPLSPTRFYTRNFFRHRQVIIPRGQGFVIVPSYMLPFDLLRRVLATLLPPSRRGPLLSRFVNNPGNFVRKSYAAARLVLETPCLQSLVRPYVRDHRVRAEVHMWQLLDDLMKIDIVRRARAGVLKARQPFGIRAEIDSTSSVLTLTSFPNDGDPRLTAAGVSPEVERAVLDGRVRMVVWDHTPMAYDIIYEAWPGRWFTVGLGAGGAHRFEALSAVCRLTAATAGVALLAILRGDVAVKPARAGNSRA
jgi:Glycosyl transferases group 1